MSDWLGAVSLPVHWERGRLRDWLTITNGYPFDASRFSNIAGTPLIRIRDLLAGSTATRFDGQVPRGAIVQDGDLLVGMDGDYNAVRWRGGTAALNQRLCKIEAGGRLTQRYLEYVLPFALKFINDLTYATTVKHLSARDIGAQSVPLPPLDEQRRIADHLDAETARIDALMAKRQRQVELLEERSAIIRRRLVWGAGEESHPGYISARLPPAPLAWPWRRLKTFALEVAGPSATGVGDLLTVSHLTGVGLRPATVTMTMAETLVGYKKCQPGDLVVNTMWAWMGALGVAGTAGLVSPAYAVYRFDADAANPQFFELLMRTPEWIDEMTAHSRGVWTSRLRLYPEDLLGLRAPLPPLKEQRRVLAEIDERIGSSRPIQAALDRQIALLKERRQALITAAVTGKLTIA